jgi:hypothetical protein
MSGEQQNTAAVGASKARLKEMDERHVNFAERDGFNLHSVPTRTISPQRHRATEKIYKQEKPKIWFSL